jgi:hypothetical protein
MDARRDSDEAVKVGRVALSVCGDLLCGCERVLLRECASGAKPGGGDTVVTCSKQREVCEIALAVGGGRLRVWILRG